MRDTSRPDQTSPPVDDLAPGEQEIDTAEDSADRDANGARPGEGQRPIRIGGGSRVVVV